MLELNVFDDGTKVVLRFEHSLLSLSKWEAKHKIAFLSSPNKKSSEMIDYYQEMLLTDVDPTIVFRLSPDQLDQLSKYINTPQTASSVPKISNAKMSTEIVTSELIYFWMTALEIDWRAESWHLSRLMMLIEIANYKKQPEKKRTQAEALKDWNAINERNKKLLGTEG